MSAFPHPFIAHTMERLGSLSAKERGKVRFVHFNHTNAAGLPDSEERKIIEKGGFHVAEENERVGL